MEVWNPHSHYHISIHSPHCQVKCGNETELNNVHEYIILNPLKWELDKENPKSMD